MPGKAISAFEAMQLLAIAFFVLLGLTYVFSMNYSTRPTQDILVQGGFCENGTVSIVLKNAGTQAISQIRVSQTSPAGDTAEDWNMPVSPGSSIVYNDLCIGKGPRYCAYAFASSGATGTQTSVYCKEAATLSDATICQRAQGGALCEGLDVLYGSGYSAACCSEWSVCC